MREEGRREKEKIQTAVCLLNPKILFSAHAPTSEVNIFHLDQKTAQLAKKHISRQNSQEKMGKMFACLMKIQQM